MEGRQGQPPAVPARKTELGSAPAGCARILVTHHLVLPKDLSSMKGRSALVSAAARAEGAPLLSGHTHDPLLATAALTTQGTSNNALSSVAGTAISDRLRKAANSYVALTIDAESIHAEVRPPQEVPSSESSRAHSREDRARPQPGAGRQSAGGRVRRRRRRTESSRAVQPRSLT